MSITFITTQTLGTLRNNFSGLVGFRFAVNTSSNITVTDLGRWVVSGNSGSHFVGLYNMVGTGTLLTSATVVTSGAAVGFAYAACTPVTLTAGSTYVVQSTETSGGDQWYDSNTVLTPVSTIGSILSAQFSILSSNGAANNSYGPVSFKISGGANATPAIINTPIISFGA